MEGLTPPSFWVMHPALCKLSYMAIDFVDLKGLEPPHNGLKVRCSASELQVKIKVGGPRRISSPIPS
jgi:hypothetical protein